MDKTQKMLKLGTFEFILCYNEIKDAEKRHFLNAKKNKQQHFCQHN